VALDPGDDVRLLLDDLRDDAAGHPLQDDVGVVAVARDPLADLGDDADAAQLVLLLRQLIVRHPLRVAGGPPDRVGQQLA
jgi:hypothetical protein